MDGERPTVYADRVGLWYAARFSDKQRKAQGLFFTSVQTADFMGAQINAKQRKVRILDPAAGAGILCCAAVEAFVSRKAKPDVIELVAYEIDAELIKPLRVVLDNLAGWCREQHGVSVRVRIEMNDFILANAEAIRSQELFSSRAQAEGFDAVIANPPYFKISKSDPRAMAIPQIVHGQPNIYGLFMAISAGLLRAGGSFVFITPRSFTSGYYFRLFRTVFFSMIRPIRVHVFGSRRDAFRRDEVLQENIILSGIRHDHWHDTNNSAHLIISCSFGVEELDTVDSRKIPARTVLDLASVDKVMRLPLCDVDDYALAVVDSWPTDLRGLGLEISTGPVVPFRATKLVSGEGNIPESHAPLLWMNHVRAMQVTWPLNRRKPEYIKRTGSEALLVSNRNYVLLRRFSAKEEVRRITAAPWIAADFVTMDVGLENHLNYIHRPGGSLSDNEAWGLAALYNSQLLDIWFRTVNGNTQVSATELRAMRLPAHETIIELGRQVKRLVDPLAGLDSLVASATDSFVLRETAVG